MTGIKILEIRNLKKAYRDFSLDIPFFQFERGKIYSILGPNGSGKTTLLELLAFLEKPADGKILFNGREIPPGTYRRKTILSMENPYFFRGTIRENISYGLSLRKFKKEIINKKVKNSLEIAGLLGFKERRGTELSQGEMKRVAMARVLALEPEIFLLDEPTQSVDKENTTIIENIMKKINKEFGTTIIFSTHNFSQSYCMADKVISLLDGKIVNSSQENLFSGEIQAEGEIKYIPVAKGKKVFFLTKKQGKVRIMINPKDIILSLKRLNSSARNSFEGTVIKTSVEGGIARVWVSCDTEFVVQVTKNSFIRMNLHPEKKVFLTFKASSVKVY